MNVEFHLICEKCGENIDPKDARIITNTLTHRYAYVCERCQAHIAKCARANVKMEKIDSSLKRGINLRKGDVTYTQCPICGSSMRVFGRIATGLRCECCGLMGLYIKGYDTSFFKNGVIIDWKVESFLPKSLRLRTEAEEVSRLKELELEYAEMTEAVKKLDKILKSQGGNKND